MNYVIHLSKRQRERKDMKRQDKKKRKTELTFSASRNYNGDEALDVNVRGGGYWSLGPGELEKALSLLSRFASGDPCGSPFARLYVRRGGWKIIIRPQAMYRGADNSSVTLSFNDFLNMPKSVLENPTMVGVRKYVATLK